MHNGTPKSNDGRLNRNTIRAASKVKAPPYAPIGTTHKFVSKAKSARVAGGQTTAGIHGGSYALDGEALF